MHRKDYEDLEDAHRIVYKALGDAQLSICDEFCSHHKHHHACEDAKLALQHGRINYYKRVLWDAWDGPRDDEGGV